MVSHLPCRLTFPLTVYGQRAQHSWVG